jgi:hypothetical protein
MQHISFRSANYLSTAAMTLILDEKHWPAKKNFKFGESWKSEGNLLKPL